MNSELKILANKPAPEKPEKSNKQEKSLAK
jgi:hypothetical protein